MTTLKTNYVEQMVCHPPKHSDSKISVQLIQPLEDCDLVSVMRLISQILSKAIKGKSKPNGGMEARSYGERDDENSDEGGVVLL